MKKRSMLYTGASRAKKRIIFIGTTSLVGDISRREEHPRRNMVTIIIRQMAGMESFPREFEGSENSRLPLDETDYIQYEPSLRFSSDV